MYFGKNDTEASALENQKGTSEYQKFVTNVGWLVNLPHTGFMGGLDPKTTGAIAPYFSSYEVEVVFPAATLMPNQPNTKQIHKSRLLYNNKILIVWVEDLNNFPLSSECNYTFCILIHPLPSRLFQIKILRKGVNEADGVPPFAGPALDNMVVGPHVLPLLVRETAINAARLLREDPLKPITQRKMWIEDFVQKFKVEHPVNQYVASQILL